MMNMIILDIGFVKGGNCANLISFQSFKENCFGIDTTKGAFKQYVHHYTERAVDLL
jgi:hypothetical protein